MNEKRVNKKRLCCRPGCGRPAAATLVYSHAEETVIVGPLSLDDNPHSWDLCARHSAQFRPPEGWTVIRDEPNVDDVDDMTALLDSVNDPQGGNHRVDAGSVAGPGARFGAGSGARHADATQGAVADIQDTISRLNGHRGEAACHRNEKRTFSTGPSTMRSQADRHGADGYAADAYNNDGYNNDPGTDSDDDAEWESESPLLQAAKNVSVVVACGVAAGKNPPWSPPMEGLSSRRAKRAVTTGRTITTRRTSHPITGLNPTAPRPRRNRRQGRCEGERRTTQNHTSSRRAGRGHRTRRRFGTRRCITFRGVSAAIFTPFRTRIRMAIGDIDKSSPCKITANIIQTKGFPCLRVIAHLLTPLSRLTTSGGRRGAHR